MSARLSEFVTRLGSAGGDHAQACVCLHEALVKVDQDRLAQLACFTARTLQDAKQLYQNEQFVLFLSLQGNKLYPLVVELGSATLRITTEQICSTLEALACVDRKAEEPLCVVLVTLNQDGSADASLTHRRNGSTEDWKFRPVMDTTQLQVQAIAHVRYAK